MHFGFNLFVGMVFLNVALDPSAAQPATTSPVSAEAAISNGVENLCSWFVRGKDYSLEAAQQKAGEAGFAKGTGVRIVPLPEMAEAGHYSVISFHANTVEPASSQEGVAAFLSFHIPVCQIQVYGHADDAANYVAALGENGWTLVDRQTRAPITAERWIGGLPDDRITLVVNRWTGPKPPPANLGFILNILPGDNRTTGAFLPE